MWQIVFTDEFDEWFINLSQDEQDSILHGLGVLKQMGHTLGRPYVDTLKGSKLNNLKELRIQHHGKPYRLFFVFDPLRQAVMLCGGDKTGEKNFYQTMMPLAQTIYQKYLNSETYLKLTQGQANENT